MICSRKEIKVHGDKIHLSIVYAASRTCLFVAIVGHFCLGHPYNREYNRQENTVEPPNNNHRQGQPIWPLLRGWPLFGGLYIIHLDLSGVFFF